MYNEQVLVFVCFVLCFIIYGYIIDDWFFVVNGVMIVFGLLQKDGLNNDGMVMLCVKVNGFWLYNVNVKNLYGEGSQVVVVLVYVNSGYYGCLFVGFQDMFFSNEGCQIYVDM